MALWLHDHDREVHLVVEAKRRSGKSGEGGHDQLARQVVNGRALAGGRAGFVGVVYLTAHLGIPVDDLEASAVALRDHFRHPPAPIWWVSWHYLAHLLDEAKARLAGDGLRGSLSERAAACLRRWRLGRFRGITPVSTLPTYRFTQGYR